MGEKHDDELDWEKLKAGRLDEGKSEAALLSGRGARTPPMVLRRMVFHAPRKAAMTRSAPGLNFHAGPSTELAKRSTAAPFHMAYSYVSRSRARTSPRSVGNRQSRARARSQGGRYHSRHHVWTLLTDGPLMKTQKAAAMRSIERGQALSSIWVGLPSPYRSCPKARSARPMAILRCWEPTGALGARWAGTGRRNGKLMCSAGECRSCARRPKSSRWHPACADSSIRSLKQASASTALDRPLRLRRTKRRWVTQLLSGARKSTPTVGAE
jgi:hypothetical protein